MAKRKSRWIFKGYSMTQETIDLIDRVSIKTGLPKSNVIVKAVWEVYGKEYGGGENTFEDIMGKKWSSLE